jgi:hypothetical protein
VISFSLGGMRLQQLCLILHVHLHYQFALADRSVFPEGCDLRSKRYGRYVWCTAKLRHVRFNTFSLRVLCADGRVNLVKIPLRGPAGIRSYRDGSGSRQPGA